MGIELAKAFINVAVNNSQLKAGLRQTESQTTSVFQRLLGVVGKFKNVIYGSWAAMTAFQGVKLAGAYEQTTIAFETMLGSAQETKETLADLTDFAAKTPFTMPGILKAARGLIQFGERGKEMMETMKILGNAASASSTDFGFLALVFNQVRGVGKLLTQDFRQLSTRGIISLQDIANHFKVTTAEAQAMLSGGKISFEDFRAVLKGLSEEGGRFANMMEKQSTSLLGLWSTLTDQWNILKREMGTPIAEALKPVLEITIEILDFTRELMAAFRDSPIGWVIGQVFDLAKGTIGLAKDGIGAIKSWTNGIHEFTKVTDNAERKVSLMQKMIEDITGRKVRFGPKANANLLENSKEVVMGSLGQTTELVNKVSEFYAINKKAAAEMVYGGKITKEQFDLISESMKNLEEKKLLPQLQEQITPLAEYALALEKIEKSGLGADAKVKAMIDRIKSQVNKISGFTSAMHSANEQLRTLKGWTDQDFKLESLSKQLRDAGFSSEFVTKKLSELRTVYDKINALTERKRLKEEGKQLSESLMTPLEKFREEADRIEKLRSAGVITAQTYDRALDQAATALAEHQIAMSETQKQMDDTVLRATEGRMQITAMHNRIQDALIQKDVGQQQLDALKTQIKMQELGLKKDDEVVKAIKDMKPKTVLS